MSEAAKSSSATASDRDAHYFQQIEQLAELYRREETQPNTAVSPERLAETDLFLERSRYEHEACAAPVFSRKAFDAKCKVIEGCEWDLDDLLILAFLIGRDAERIGVKRIPRFIRDRQGETFPGPMKERVDLSAEFYAQRLAELTG
jgi:hypothetical protein